MKDENYISKKEAEKRGYRKRKEGGYYKMSALDKYFENGDLELKDSPFSAEDRKKAGEMLVHDYYLGRYNKLQSMKLFLSVNKGNCESGLESALYYRERYLEAVKSVPSEFWSCVRKVCIEDEELKVEKEISSQTLLGKQRVYFLKRLLCLGLERLVKHYLKKDKKSS